MGRAVVLTGANSGIGRATALELARVGYDVSGTARTAAKAGSLVAAAGERGLTLRTVLCDVADAASTAAAFAEIAGLTGGGPWAVVNNAGIAQSGALEDVSDADARHQLEVNLVAPVRIARLVLPGMRERGDGRIVNVSSVAGRVATRMMGWYAASKAGLAAASNVLRIEVEAFGVRVVLVEPGGFGTGIWDDGQQRLPAGQDGPYADAYRRAHAGTGRLGALLPDPVWVARVVRVALGSPVPLPRYRVGADAVGLVLNAKLLPTMVTDRVKALAAGLARLPFAGRAAHQTAAYNDTGPGPAAAARKW